MSFYPQTNHPGPAFCPFISKTCPVWVCERSRVGQGAHPAPQVCRAGLREDLSWPGGLSQHELNQFFMPESAQVTVFVRHSQRARSSWVVFCLFAAFGFDGIYPVWALRGQNYFPPVVKSLCTLRLNIKKRILITFNFKPLMGCDHSRAPSREFVAKEKKNHSKIGLIS